MQRQFIITLDMPKSATLDEMEIYLTKAIEIWKGSLDPENPISELDSTSVKVKRIIRKQKRKKE